LFTILVGPPATGKGRVLKTVKSIVQHETMKRVLEVKIKGQPGKPPGEVLIVNAIDCTPDSITFEALFKWLGTPDRINIVMVDQKAPDGSVLSVPIKHTSALCLLEELAVFMTKDTEQVVSTLCQCYDAGNLDRVTKHQGEDHIYNVCVNFIAGTTPDDMIQLMQDRIVGKGFASRVILVFAPGQRKRNFDSSMVSTDSQQHYNELVQYVLNLTTKVNGEVKLTPEAYEFMKSHYEGDKWKECVNTDKTLNTYYGRKIVHWKKLAAVVHFANTYDNMEVTLDDAQIALNLLNRTEQPMHMALKVVGLNKLCDIAEDVISHMRELGGVANYRKLFLRSFSNGTKKEFDEVLQFLEITGQIYQKATEVWAIKPQQVTTDVEAIPIATVISQQQLPDTTTGNGEVVIMNRGKVASI